MKSTIYPAVQTGRHETNVLHHVCYYLYFVVDCGCATLSAPIAFSSSLSHNIVQLRTQQVRPKCRTQLRRQTRKFRAPLDGTYEVSVSMLSPGGKWAGVEIVIVGSINMLVGCTSCIYHSKQVLHQYNFCIFVYARKCLHA